MVIYNKLFKKIFNEPFSETLTVNERLTEIASNKMVLFPFISIQQAHELNYPETGGLLKQFKDALGSYN